MKDGVSGTITIVYSKNSLSVPAAVEDLIRDPVEAWKFITKYILYSTLLLSFRPGILSFSKLLNPSWHCVLLAYLFLYNLLRY